MRNVSFLPLLFSGLVVTFPNTAYAQAAPASDARAALGALRDAQLARGIQDDRFVPIGGIDQWISVRGRHKDAPLLLFLHGGPGLSSIPSSWSFVSPWEEYFTVVQWDQRGTGKTLQRNAAGAKQLSLEQMVADAEEVVRHLQRTYGQRKIALLGFSWGSILGVELLKRHPDWFSVYVGMSQFVSFSESEKRGYEATLADARAAGDTRTVAQLTALAPYPRPDLPVPLFFGLRGALAKYGGMTWTGDTARLKALDALSPDVDPADLAGFDGGTAGSFVALWPTISRVDYSTLRDFKVPVVFIDGRHDRNTSAAVLGAWFKTLRAPAKKMVWFDQSAHFAYQEEPGKMLVTLVNDVLPFAQRDARAAKR
jgi:pimeloyl-ACP methyl ester carboxylesterase